MRCPLPPRSDLTETTLAGAVISVTAATLILLLLGLVRCVMV